MAKIKRSSHFFLDGFSRVKVTKLFGSPMSKYISETLIKVMLASIVVGVLLAFFNIELKELLENFDETIQGIFEIVARIVEWAVKYILLWGVLWFRFG
jgi:hypothetical protein